MSLDYLNWGLGNMVLGYTGCSRANGGVLLSFLVSGYLNINAKLELKQTATKTAGCLLFYLGFSDLNLSNHGVSSR
jgi:hypothetical protein